MTEYNNENKGAVWNKNKVKETDRDYGGEINIEGVEYWLNGWKGDGGNKPAIKFSVTKKEMREGDTTVKEKAEEVNLAEESPF